MRLDNGKQLLIHFWDNFHLHGYESMNKKCGGKKLSEEEWERIENGRKKITLISKIDEARLIGPDLVRETTEKIEQIKDRLKVARDRQKSYADVRRKPLEFQVGDMVMLKVSPWKGVIRFGKRGKLNPRYIGPFEI